MKTKHQFGALLVLCSPEISPPDTDPLIVIINNYTTCADLIGLVLTRYKAKWLDTERFVAVSYCGPKGGPYKSKVLPNTAHPLEMQLSSPKGQTRFGVQKRGGLIVKVYDTREWPVEPYGDIYLTDEYTTQQILTILLKFYVTRKKVTKFTLAIGDTSGKIYRFLPDETKPFSEYQHFLKSSEVDSRSICLLIAKKVKPSKKHMFRSLSWASLTNSDQLKLSVERKFKKSKRKSKESKEHPVFSFNDSIKQKQLATLDQHRASDLCQLNNSNVITEKLRSLGYPKIKKGKRGSTIDKSATCPRTHLSTGTLQGSYSCDNIFSVVPTKSHDDLLATFQDQHPVGLDKDTTGSASDTAEKCSLLPGKSLSLGDISCGETLALAPTSLLRNPNESGVDDMNYSSQSWSRYSDIQATVKLRNAAKKIYAEKPSRKSCIGTFNYGSQNTTQVSHIDHTEDSSVIRTPSNGAHRSRRTLPQIPSNDIELKQKRFADLVKRRLTICGGEIRDGENTLNYETSNGYSESFEKYERTSQIGDLQHSPGELNDKKLFCHSDSLSAEITKAWEGIDGFRTLHDVGFNEEVYPGSRGHLTNDTKSDFLQPQLTTHREMRTFGSPRTESSIHTRSNSYGDSQLSDKPSSRYSNDSGTNAVSQHSSMIDSGYITNGESDSGSYFHNRIKRRGNQKQPDLLLYTRDNVTNRKTSLSSCGSDPITSPECHSSPKPIFEINKPSLYQLLDLFQLLSYQMKLPLDTPLETHIKLSELSIELPQLAMASVNGVSSKSSYGPNLGGPGSAFKRIKKTVRQMHNYTLVAIQWLKEEHGTSQYVLPGDVLVEVNGQSVLGLHISEIMAMLSDVVYGNIETVLARRLPLNENTKLPREINKLRQQCLSLISDFNTGDGVETTLPSMGETGFLNVSENCEELEMINGSTSVKRPPDTHEICSTFKNISSIATNVHTYNKSGFYTSSQPDKYAHEYELSNNIPDVLTTFKTNQLSHENKENIRHYNNSDTVPCDINNQNNTRLDGGIRHMVYHRNNVRNKKVLVGKCSAESTSSSVKERSPLRADETKSGLVAGPRKNKIYQRKERPYSDGNLDFSPVLSAPITNNTSTFTYNAHESQQNVLSVKIDNNSPISAQSTKANLNAYFNSSLLGTRCVKPDRLPTSRRETIEKNDTIKPKLDENAKNANEIPKESKNRQKSDGKRGSWNMRHMFKWRLNKGDKKDSQSDSASNSTQSQTDSVNKNCEMNNGVCVRNNNAITRHADSSERSNKFNGHHTESPIGNDSHTFSHNNIESLSPTAGVTDKLNQFLNSKITPRTVPDFSKGPVRNSLLNVYDYKLGENEFIV